MGEKELSTVDEGELVSTVLDVKIPDEDDPGNKGAEKAGEEAGGKDADAGSDKNGEEDKDLKDGEGGKDKDGDAGEDKPDKDAREGFIPRERFDEVNARAKRVPELEAKLAKMSGQLDVLMKTAAPSAEDNAGEPDFIDGMSDMGTEELMDKIETNPKEFFDSYADALTKRITSTMSAQSTEKDLESEITRTIEKFSESHTDFNDMWDSGKIMGFMDDNPGYDAMGAYYALTEDTRSQSMKAQIDEAVEKAVKETEAKYQKLLKRENASLPGGPAATDAGSGVPSQLKDTKKHGGVIRSITERVLAGRQSV